MTAGGETAGRSVASRDCGSGRRDQNFCRGAQESLDHGLLIACFHDAIRDRDGSHEMVRVPMSDRRQSRQNRDIGRRMAADVKIGLIVMLVARGEADADRARSCTRAERDQGVEIEMMRPATDGRSIDAARNDSSPRLAQRSLHIVLWSSVLFGMATVVSGMMRASGTVFAPMALPIFAIAAVEVPSAVILSRSIGVEGIWAAYPITFTAMFILQMSYYMLVWRRRTVQRLI